MRKLRKRFMPSRTTTISERVRGVLPSLSITGMRTRNTLSGPQTNASEAQERSPGAGDLQCHIPSVRLFPEHDPAAAAGGGEGGQRGLGADLDLAGAGGAAELLDRVGVHGGAAAPGAEVAARRTERVRALDPDVALVELEGVAALDAVPLEGLEEKLRHRGIAVVRIEYIDVVGPEPGALVHSPGGAVGPVLDLVQIFLGAALPEIVLRVVEHIDRLLPHVAGALGGREEIGGRGIDRPVAIPQPQRVQDEARLEVILDRQLRHVVAGVVPPRRQEAVPVLVDDERGEVVVLAAVFPAILAVREDVDEIVAAVIAPGRRPLAGAAGVVVGVLAAATIAAFEIAGRVDDETGGALAVAHGLRRHAHHFADRRHAGRGEFNVGEAHLRDQPLRVYEGQPPLRIVGRREIWPRRPLRRGAAAAAGDMAVAADDSVDLVRRHAGLVHRLLAGQDRVGAERLVHRDFVPATVDRRMPDPGHRDLAAVLPNPKPVLVSPPLIPG